MKTSRSMMPARRENGGQVTPFDALQTQVDRLFSDFSRGFGLPRMWEGGGMPFPSLEMREEGDKVILTAELPGVDENNIDISADGEMLTISGEKKSEYETGEGENHRSERMYGRFSRSLALPFEIEPNKVEARYDRGVLKLTIPRPAHETQSSKKIQIKH